MRIVLILGVLASPNHPSWGHLGVTVSGHLFRGPSPHDSEGFRGGIRGPVFEGFFPVKTIKNVKLSSLLGSWLQDGPKMVQQRSKMA